MSGSSKRTLATGIVVVLAGVALAVFGLASTRSQAGGRPAPPLPRESLAGPHVTLASLLSASHGRPALVVFWASWCTSCAQEAPALESLYNSPQGRGRMVGVDWSDPESGDARSFIRHYRWTFPILRDQEGTVGNSYGLGAGLPDTFVLSANGRIRQVLRGPQTVSSLRSALLAAERS
jgi:thiol-disulfide isomerase/thioredoxin